MQTSIRPSTSPRPFLPSDINGSRSLVRAVLAHVLREQMGGRTAPTPEALVAKHWPGDRVAMQLVRRAATAPIAITGEPAISPQNVVTDFVLGLQRLSGAAQLIAAGLRPSLQGIQTLKIPYDTSPVGDEPTFVGEGLPIPVPQMAFATTPLGPPKKLQTIRALTDELVQHSIPSAEMVIRALLTEAVARALDKAIFSNTAASAIRPAGILNGVTPIGATANTGSTINIEVVATDFANLINPLADAGGGKRVLLFMSPGKAIALAITAPGLALARELGAEIVGVPTLPNNELIAVEANGFASAFGSDPEIQTANQMTIHMESAAPADIGTVGTPNVVAAPTKSMFQTQSTAIRLTLPCAWAMRAPGLVQWIAAVNW
jgi:hypothetical protein